MKNLKKILSVVLVFMLALSACVMSTSAADYATDAEPIIYFEVPEEWGEYTSVYCHIWSYGGSALANWQSKKEKCTATDTEDLYSYNISKVGTLEDGATYCVIFSVTEGGQTYDALMSTECYGDTLYCDTENVLVNPEDSNKVAFGAYWRTQDKAKYGPELKINSLGDVTGSALPAGVTKSDVLTSFITGPNLANAAKFTGLTELELIRKAGGDLGLTETEIEDVITETGYASTPDETTPDETTPDEATPGEALILGDAYHDGKVNIKDATFIQKVVAGLESFASDFDALAGDVNSDATVNVKDATAIQKFIAGIETGLDIGKQLY